MGPSLLDDVKLLHKLLCVRYGYTKNWTESANGGYCCMFYQVFYQSSETQHDILRQCIFLRKIRIFLKGLFSFLSVVSVTAMIQTRQFCPVSGCSALPPPVNLGFFHRSLCIRVSLLLFKVISSFLCKWKSLRQNSIILQLIQKLHLSPQINIFLLVGSFKTYGLKAFHLLTTSGDAESVSMVL